METRPDVSANLTAVAAGNTAVLDTNGNNIAFATTLPTGGLGTVVKNRTRPLTVPGTLYANSYAWVAPGRRWNGGEFPDERRDPRYPRQFVDRRLLRDLQRHVHP